MRKVTQGIDYTTRDYQAYKELLINKLQENYFSTISQCFPYLTATAVTYPNALI